MRLLANSAIILALALVASLVWIGQQRPPDTYLEAVQKSGTLRVGLDPTYPPFESLSGGQYVGHDVDLAKAIAGDLGVRVEFKPLALDTQYDALASGQVDMLISALPFIYERQKEVRYSRPYYQAGQVIVVRAGDTSIKSKPDLQGKRVGVELGSNADTDARQLARTGLPMQVISDYRSAQEAMAALSRGEVDAAIVDNTSAQQFLADTASLKVLSPSLTDEPYVVAMPVQATALAAGVDAIINRLAASGELDQMMGENSK
jgi:arginine/lysine/histidine transporter system substrate-binding protein